MLILVVHLVELKTHRRPLVVLSTQMALLRLSADIPYVGTQKDILGLKLAKTL